MSEAPPRSVTLNRDRIGQVGGKLAPWLVALAFLVLYAATAGPSVVELFDDSLELQLVLPTFGIAHPTGYPLYTLLGGLWSRALFPFGNWAWRVNILSSVAAAATVGLVFVLGRRLSAQRNGRPDLWAGLAAALAFGLGPVWWAQATVAEVYALHNLLVAAVLAVAVGVERRAGRAFTWRMGLLFFLVGLGLAHHRTIVLLLPGLAVYLIWQAPRMLRPQRAWLLWLLALAAPLLLYSYIPLRVALGVRDLHGSYLPTWTGFWDHVLARGYTGFFTDNPLSVTRRAADRLQLWVEQLGWWGALLFVVGLGQLVRRRLPSFAGWVMLGVVLATNFGFALLYRVGDQQVFMIPAFLCAAIFVGGGVNLLRWPLRRPGLSAVAGLIAVLLLLVDPGRGAPVDRSRDWAAHDYAVDMAKVDFAPGSRVIGLEGEMTALRYMQEAEDLGSRATAIAADDPAARRAAVAAAVAAGEPVYLTRELDGIADQYSFTAAGPLVRVWPRGRSTTATPAHPLAVTMLDGDLRIEGYDLERLDWAGGPAARLTLHWRPLAGLSRDLKISLRVQAADGTLRLRADGQPAVEDHFPLRQVAPTTSWAPGGAIADVYTVPLPAVRSPDDRLLVIIYDADTLAEVGRVELPVGR